MPEASVGATIVGVLIAFPFVGTTSGTRNRLIADAVRFPVRRGDPCGRPPGAGNRERPGAPRCSDARSRRWAGCGSDGRGHPQGAPLRNSDSRPDPNSPCPTLLTLLLSITFGAPFGQVTLQVLQEQLEFPSRKNLQRSDREDRTFQSPPIGGTHAHAKLTVPYDSWLDLWWRYGIGEEAGRKTANLRDVEARAFWQASMARLSRSGKNPRCVFKPGQPPGPEVVAKTIHQDVGGRC